MVATALALARTLSGAVRRVEVAGMSMAPALQPGDRLLVVRLGRRPTRPGDVVTVPDPRRSGRLLVKRVVSVGGDGIVVAGDNAGASTDSRAFGPVERAGVWGVARYRYAPPGRAGVVRRGPRDAGRPREVTPRR